MPQQDRMNTQQAELLNSYMLEHPEIAKKKHDCENGPELWRSLVTQLNSFGPPCKNIVRWKKTWADVTYKLREKYRQQVQHKKEMGGKPGATNRLSKQQLVLLKVIGIGKLKGVSEETFGSQEPVNSASKPSSLLSVPRVKDEELEDPLEMYQDITEVKHLSRSKDKIESQMDRMTSEQNQLLQTFMLEHPEIARKKIYCPNAAELWASLVARLNLLGPPRKDLVKWKKTWVDILYTLRGKYKQQVQHKKGGRPVAKTRLSQQQIELIKALEIAKSMGVSGATAKLKEKPTLPTMKEVRIKLVPVKTLISSVKPAPKPSPVLSESSRFPSPVLCESSRVTAEEMPDFTEVLPTEPMHFTFSKDNIKTPTNFELSPGHNMGPFEKSVIELLTDLREEKRRQNALLEQQVKQQRDLIKIKFEKLHLYREVVERKRKEHNRKWNINSWRVENTDFTSD